MANVNEQQAAVEPAESHMGAVDTRTPDETAQAVTRENLAKPVEQTTEGTPAPLPGAPVVTAQALSNAAEATRTPITLAAPTNSAPFRWRGNQQVAAPQNKVGGPAPLSEVGKVNATPQQPLNVPRGTNLENPPEQVTNPSQSVAQPTNLSQGGAGASGSAVPPAGMKATRFHIVTKGETISGGVPKQPKEGTLEASQDKVRLAGQERAKYQAGTPEYQQAHSNFVAASAEAHRKEADEQAQAKGTTAPQSVADFYGQKAQYFKGLESNKDATVAQHAQELSKYFSEQQQHWQNQAQQAALKQQTATSPITVLDGLNKNASKDAKSALMTIDQNSETMRMLFKNAADFDQFRMAYKQKADQQDHAEFEKQYSSIFSNKVSPTSEAELNTAYNVLSAQNAQAAAAQLSTGDTTGMTPKQIAMAGKWNKVAELKAQIEDDKKAAAMISQSIEADYSDKQRLFATYWRSGSDAITAERMAEKTAPKQQARDEKQATIDNQNYEKAKFNISLATDEIKKLADDAATVQEVPQLKGMNRAQLAAFVAKERDRFNSLSAKFSAYRKGGFYTEQVKPEEPADLNTNALSNTLETAKGQTEE